MDVLQRALADTVEHQRRFRCLRPDPHDQGAATIEAAKDGGFKHLLPDAKPALLLLDDFDLTILGLPGTPGADTVEAGRINRLGRDPVPVIHRVDFGAVQGLRVERMARGLVPLPAEPAFEAAQGVVCDGRISHQTFSSV